MVGIVLVTKPPFLFPPNQAINATLPNVTNLLHDYLDRNYVLYDLRIVNWTDSSLIPTNFEVIKESNGDLYFVGAIIALSSAIFSASNNIVIAKLVSFSQETKSVLNEIQGYQNLIQTLHKFKITMSKIPS